MDEINARREFPIWAAAILPEPIREDGTRVYQPKKNRQEGRKHRAMKEPLLSFMKKRGIALILLFAFVLYGLAVSAITKRKVTEEVTEKVTSEMRAGFQQYLKEQEEQQRRDQFLTGDASMEAAVTALADYFDELIATYAMDYGVSEQGLYTLGWVFIARVIQSSSEFGRTPQEILEKRDAWEGKVVGHAVRNQDTQIAISIARDYLTGNYPDDFTPSMTFGDRERNGGFVARNEYVTGPNTVYWRYKK